MPSKSPLTALRDILHHIELAAHFVTGFDDKAFLADARTVYAVTRCELDCVPYVLSGNVLIIVRAAVRCVTLGSKRMLCNACLYRPPRLTATASQTLPARLQRQS
jgi:hypothetical protein